MKKIATSPKELPSLKEILSISGLEFMKKIQNGDLPIAPIAEVLNYDLVSVKSGEVIFFFFSTFKSLNLIRKLSDGKFTLKNKQSHLASMMGMHIDMGLSAVLKTHQLTLLLTSIKTPPMDLGQLLSQDINPEEAKLIVIKAAVSHKDAYDPISSYSFYIDSQGLCTSNLKRLPFKKIGNKVIALN